MLRLFAKTCGEQKNEKLPC